MSEDCEIQGSSAGSSTELLPGIWVLANSYPGALYPFLQIKLNDTVSVKRDFKK